MPTSPESNDRPRRRPRDRKEQILLAARDLFVARGYPNVSMALIAEQVGITASALYRHFGNKTVLLEEVIADNFGWLDEPVACTTYDEMVEHVITRIVDRPYLSDLWAHEIRYLPEGRRHDLRRRMRVWNQSLVPALRERRPDLGAVHGELLTWAIQSLMSCVGRQAIGSPMSVKLPLVRAALHAVATVDLVSGDTPAGRRTDRMVPVSTRERLLISAAAQFGERGYHDTSMAQIGAAADVSGPSLYSYFEDKIDVLRAVLERGTHALWIGVDDALASSGTVVEALRRLVRSYIPLSRTWAWIIEDPSVEDGLAAAAKAAQREYVTEWVTLLQQASPRTGVREARVRVQIALFVIADLHRVPHLSRSVSFQGDLAEIVLAVLLDARSE
ncbi:TetR/AcrR family transcriptional regulator [Actinomadura sp. 7K507]|uniref:TetR/AcrR family transcriptional regulator n=1 Tax=Actinomadura sp. 7K507 TaxID=2530365 RepID=UPI001044387F|nr:TetR/AcrR family transcriptional regulator [Actinomadura sp. 7K507]TDC88534.1 TetR/AcrR family transcriptional regulator [Actinomadura sp. 7K507]